MDRLSVLAAIISILLFFASCSGPSDLSQQGSGSDMRAAKESPSWYKNQPVVNTGPAMRGYATALSEDSTSSVSKAVSWAESEIKSSLSDKLETIRSAAKTEFGSAYGLDSPRFLIALRKADQAVSPLVEIQRAEVKRVEGHNSYRSFTEVMVPKDALLERIGKQLSGYEKAWKAMKKTKAFKNF